MNELIDYTPGTRKGRWWHGAALAAGALAASMNAAAQVSVAISPSSLTTATNATEVLTATVTGTTNTAVSWQVNGVQGGNTVAGVVSTTIPGTTGEALYLAPGSIPAGGTVTVTAVSQADPSKAASALLTIQAPSRSGVTYYVCLLYTSPSPRDRQKSRMPSSA